MRVMVQRITVETVSEIATSFSLKKSWSLLVLNKPFQRLVLVVCLAGVCLGVLNSLAIFIVDDGLGLPGAFFTLFLIEYVAAIACTPLIVRLANRFGKHWVMSGGMAVFAFSLVLYALGPRESYLLAVAGIALLGCGMMSMLMMGTSILADIVDFDTITSDDKRAGIFMAFYKFASKFS